MESYSCLWPRILLSDERGVGGEEGSSTGDCNLHNLTRGRWGKTWMIRRKGNPSTSQVPQPTHLLLEFFAFGEAIWKKADLFEEASFCSLSAISKERASAIHLLCRLRSQVSASDCWSTHQSGWHQAMRFWSDKTADLCWFSSHCQRGKYKFTDISDSYLWETG